MGTDKTEYCFFTGEKVISCDETNGDFLDGYYYRIEFNGMIREIKLYESDDWANDAWIKENGGNFLRLIDKYEKWNFFRRGKSISDVKLFYDLLLIEH